VGDVRDVSSEAELILQLRSAVESWPARGSWIAAGGNQEEHPMPTSRLLRPISIAAPLFAFALAPAQVQADQPAPGPAQAKYEIRFMTEMIDHHMMAVMTGQTCLNRAFHPELLQTCQNIVTSQMQEIQTLQSWLSDWYGISYSPEMTPGMQRQMEKMAELSPAEFEQAFMEMMIRHHWMAIVKASQCAQKAYHAELVTLCENIMAAQSQEIIMMRTWLCEWYGVCRNGPGAPVTQ
jgi:uncharacterized protein (DUF305 family)